MNNRYSLVSYHDKKREIIQSLEYDSKNNKTIKKDKTSLVKLDLLTSNFTDIKEFNMFYNMPPGAKIFIVYTSKNQEKQLPCVFNDNSLIRYFASTLQDNNKEININDEYFLKFFKRFLLACNVTQMRNNMMNDFKINTYIKNKINDYILYNGQPFTLIKLKQELVKYKNLRSVILNIYNYDKNFLSFNVPTIDLDYFEQTPEFELSRFIPSSIEEEPSFPPNSIEERLYNTYLENLPVEYSCHDIENKLYKKR